MKGRIGIITGSNSPRAPLVNIEGIADKATVDLASKQVLQSLRSIIVEPSSIASAATQKRIRRGSVFT